MIRILVVDDSAPFRHGLEVLLDRRKNLGVIGHATCGPEAISAARRLAPDVVLMDIRMAGGDGIAATRVLTAPPIDIPVVLMTSFHIDDYVFQGLAAGTTGLLLKTAPIDDYSRAIQAANDGEIFLSPGLVHTLVAALPERLSFPARYPPDASADTLTAREIELLRVLCDSPTDTASLAEHLGVSMGTVKSHLTHMMSKLDVHSRAELVAYAYRRRIMSG